MNQNDFCNIYKLIFTGIINKHLRYLQLLLIKWKYLKLIYLHKLILLCFFFKNRSNLFNIVIHVIITDDL